MIKTKVDSVNEETITQELTIEGSTYQILAELKALAMGVLNGMDMKRRGSDSEMTIDERIEFFCTLLKDFGDKADNTEPTTDETAGPTIDDWEYHIRMLGDIAKRNGASLVMSYDPEPKNIFGKSARAIVGNGAEIITMTAALITDAAMQTENISPAELSDEINKLIKGYQAFRERSNEEQTADGGTEAEV